MKTGLVSNGDQACFQVTIEMNNGMPTSRLNGNVTARASVK